MRADQQLDRNALDFFVRGPRSCDTRSMFSLLFSILRVLVVHAPTFELEL